MNLNNFPSHYTKNINRYLVKIKSKNLFIPISNIRKEIEFAARNDEKYYIFEYLLPKYWILYSKVNNKSKIPSIYDNILKSAALGGHLQKTSSPIIIELLAGNLFPINIIENGATDFNSGLMGAAIGGHLQRTRSLIIIEIIKIIKMGLNNF